MKASIVPPAAGLGLAAVASACVGGHRTQGRFAIVGLFAGSVLTCKSGVDTAIPCPPNARPLGDFANDVLVALGQEDGSALFSLALSKRDVEPLLAHEIVHAVVDRFAQPISFWNECVADALRVHRPLVDIGRPILDAEGELTQWASTAGDGRSPLEDRDGASPRWWSTPPLTPEALHAVVARVESDLDAVLQDDFDLQGIAACLQQSRCLSTTSVSTTPGPLLAKGNVVGLHAAAAFDGRDRKRLLRQLAYMLRPPFAMNNITRHTDGMVRLTFWHRCAHDSAFTDITPPPDCLSGSSLLRVLPAANWSPHQNDTSFILFRTATRSWSARASAKRQARVGYAPAHGPRTTYGERPGVRSWLLSRIPVRMNDTIARKSTVAFSAKIEPPTHVRYDHHRPQVDRRVFGEDRAFARLHDHLGVMERMPVAAFLGGRRRSCRLGPITHNSALGAVCST